MGLFGKPAKAATPSQQASVGYYDETGPFGSTNWEKNKAKGGAGYTKKVTLSPDELARLGISDDLRSKLAQFSHLFKADNPIYNPLISMMKILMFIDGNYMYNDSNMPEQR